MFVVSNPIPLKYAMRMIGFDVGGTRLPLIGPDEATGAKIMAEVGEAHNGLAHSGQKSKQKDR